MLSRKLEFVSPEGLRIDGRRPNELRRIQARVGVFMQADGSAYIEQGNTKILATVYGPHEVSRKNKPLHDRAIINCEYRVASFATAERKKPVRTDKRALDLAAAVRGAFEGAVMTQLYPRSQIDIFLQVLQSDGGNRAVCINAATLALMDAGIAMKDFVCACSVGCIDDTPLLDINYIEDSAGGPDLTVAVLARSRKTVLVEMDSRLHIDRFDDVLRLAIDGCQAIHSILDSAMVERTKALLAGAASGADADL
ncbi:exosome component 4 [Capsaspora owczarzaki ATCC 30864]|uniref:Exosome component 4 n=1 Tax=Capsaspora owczarzaki (strain ATCC 30864) TaxID=595528 RepID=A0A0D2U8G7_CAPO3|nr:exosome component 4 [Capsaspora owczarzaki ATCC 30864]KJE91386.1 exosome component 4 [Capsaspora owczarzaki ATCC 30864]|eukprot:XP_004349273.1 exosome component 4 [Capsaspora owczarzaki ATCC 30864]